MKFESKINQDGTFFIEMETSFGNFRFSNIDMVNAFLDEVESMTNELDSFCCEYCEKMEEKEKESKGLTELQIENIARKVFHEELNKALEGEAGEKALKSFVSDFFKIMSNLKK